MIIFIYAILYFVLIGYAFFCRKLERAWQLLTQQSPERFSPVLTADLALKIAVVIPVRNEALHLPQLLTDLSQQTLEFGEFEVWVVDDHSTDETPDMVQKYAKQSTFVLNYVASQRPDSGLWSPKKYAIQQVVERTQAQLIVCTDGDCRLPTTWLEYIQKYQQSSQSQCITLPVTFSLLPEQLPSMFYQWQVVEFASLIGAGAVSLFWKNPSMANGANFCYTKSAFEAVDGFAGNEHIASGDDEFLLHKIFEKYPKQCAFLAHPSVIVSTQANKDWPQFFAQRKRWASKWRSYKSIKTTALAVSIFLCNLSWILSLGLLVQGLWMGWFFAIPLFVGLSWAKFWYEHRYLRAVLFFLEQEKCFKSVWWVQLSYPFYVVFFGLVAQQKGYTWKGRKWQ
jgi:glycosyltransferase involved in cell wall biosynthesis